MASATYRPGMSAPPPGRTRLDPTTWPAEEVAELLDLSSSLRGPAGYRRFARACVTASTGPLGSYAGRRALEEGGSAVDAVLTTAFTQIASAAGCWVSFAGLLTMVHYEAATGEVTSLDAGFRTFREETDAATIPAAPEPSGRTALVPGFFAGAWAAHQRFGRLPWADLLLPAIWVADGVPLGSSLAGSLVLRESVLRRTEEGRAALLPAGRLPTEGEVLVQAELARTLRRVAADGVNHIYRGQWAEQFVEVVRREGGRVQLADLESYAPNWSAPLTGSAHGYDVFALGLPSTGGAALIEGVKVAEQLGIGDLRTDPQAMHLLVQVARSNHALAAVPAAERVSDEHAARVAKLIRETGEAALPSVFSPGGHSDFALAADEAGNVVAICHSINTAAWGNTGLFVDGISIPDAASFQQPMLATVTPGDPLPTPTNPAIVLRDGAPVLASSSIGAGLVETTLTCLHQLLAHDVPLADVVAGPLVHGPNYGPPVSDSINNDVTDEESEVWDLTTLGSRLREQAAERGWDPHDAFAMVMRRAPQSVTGPVDADAVKTFGVHVKVEDDDAAFLRGYWGGIARDPETGHVEGARTAFLNARVEGLQ